MARSPLTNLVADVVDERLRVEGFTRRGKIWFATNELGDHVIIELAATPRLPGMERFQVWTGAIPAPWWSWMRTVAPAGRRPGAVPNVGDALLSDSVEAPDDGPAGLGWTVSNPAEATRTGALLADLLTTGHTDRLRALLRRPALLAALADNNRRTPAIAAAFAAEWGPSAELDELLAQYAAWRPDNHEFVSWAKAYAAEQGRM